MEKMLIGSSAIRHYFPDFPRKINDIDYIVNKIPTNVEGNIEYYCLDLIPMQDVIDVNHLYTLKISHSNRNFNWFKHFKDIQFLSQKGCFVDETLLSSLVYHWDEYHGKRNEIDFNKPNETFFSDNVERKYNHDSLHLHFKYDDLPKYYSIKRDFEMAKVEEDMFMELSQEDKIKIVLEEQYVIAFERYVLNGVLHRVSLNKALGDLVTRLFPNWLSFWVLKNSTLFLTQTQFEFFRDRCKQI